MNRRRLWSLCALPVGALALAGCTHCGNQSCYPPPPAVRTAAILPASPLAPCRACPVPAAPPPGTLGAPVVPPGSIGAYQPLPAAPIQQAWGPASPPGASLGGPVPIAPEKPRESARLNPPESPEPPRANLPEKPAAPETPEKPRRSPGLPAGIANFAEALPNVTVGSRPLLEGIGWLKDNNTKAVLFVRGPEEESAGDRRLFEQRGLTYLTLEASPKTLTPELVDQFNKIVADAANRPLFVYYDRDGTLAGGLWYLYFRTVAKLGDEEARKKAAALGLKDDGDGPQRDMWLAVQKYLADRDKKE